VIGRRSLLLAGAAIPTAAYGQCVINAPAVDACLGGVRNAGPAGATLDLNFMFPGSMPPGLTFTRASTATYTDASGVIQTAAVNQPRWDYASGSLRGLLIEEARTNLLLNSATLSTQSVTVTAQAYTLSFYGTGTVTKSGAATGALVGTGAGQRVTQTFTPTAGTLTCTVTGSVTNAQIEAGPFATSWISTAGATATRAIDLCQTPVNVSWYSGAAFSFCTEFDGPPSPWSGAMVGFSDASFGNSLYGGPDAGVNMGFSHIPSGGSSPQQVISRTGVNKVVSTFTTTRLSISSNGAVAAGAAQTATAFTVPTRLVMGNDPWSMSTAFNGHIRRVTYWNRALSDTEMQQVTT
jgi:hypothetical protein